MGTLAENIAVGQFQPEFEKISKLIKQLGLEDFVSNLPNGVNTQIGEHGASLSGGERQRVAIARSLYKEPRVLILDEVTSSLDSISENYVQQTLNKLVEQGVTIIVIAHRLSTIKLADNVIVLEKGKVAENGKHDELLEKKGTYYHLWHEQYNHLE